MENVSVISASPIGVCHVCQCTLCGKCNNGPGCCDVCSQNCDCAGCGFQLGKATGDEVLKMRQSNLGANGQMVDNVPK